MNGGAGSSRAQTREMDVVRAWIGRLTGSPATPADGGVREARRHSPEVPFSDAAHGAGMKFLLWIEPERATYGTPVTQPGARSSDGHETAGLRTRGDFQS